MAKYDRNILVPHLHDASSIEIIITELERKISTEKQVLSVIYSNINQHIPNVSKPVKNTNVNSDPFFLYCLFFFVFLILLFRFSVVSVVLVILAVKCYFSWIGEKQRAEDEAEFHYHKQLEEYNRNRAFVQKIKEDIQYNKLLMKPQEEKIDELEQLLQAAKMMRNDVYSVNIIPQQFRNRDAMCYLYDFFSTCQETDLESTIRTMLLDDIKKQLHTLAEQNSEMILNQRIQIALSEQSNYISSVNNRNTVSALNQIADNQDMQNKYQQMIAQNQNMTNFLLAYNMLAQEHSIKEIN